MSKKHSDREMDELAASATGPVETNPGTVSPIRPDWWAVCIERTLDYNIRPDDKKYIKAIKEVYIYNRSEHTYCCELTPSYWLVHLYTFIEFNEDELSENMRDHLDQHYCHEPTDNCYMHVSSVERMPAEVKKQFGADEQNEEIVREYWQGNCPF